MATAPTMEGENKKDKGDLRTSYHHHYESSDLIQEARRNAMKALRLSDDEGRGDGGGDSRDKIMPTETATTVDPILANQRKNSGNKKFASKDWDGAYEDYSQAIEVNYHDATFYSNRSACLIQMNRPEEALVDAISARTLRPDWSKACYRMAVSILAIADADAETDLDAGTDMECDDEVENDNVTSEDKEDLFQTAAMVIWDGLLLDPKNADLKILLRRCAKSGRRQARNNRRRQHRKSKK